ncbi:MAG: sigma-54-dependent Fis family transcriptional regulator [Planctomycetes bacterium]|nr:sigma-54-dependent Fis family transcriptional regulator [Planctomycetota bacterium]
MILPSLVVDPDPATRASVGALLESEGWTVEHAATLEDARAFLKSHPPSLVVVEVRLPDGSGLDLVREIQPLPGTEAIMLSAEASPEAIRLGAADVLAKPVETAPLRRALARVRRTLRLRGEIGSLRSELRSLGRFGRMIGASPAMHHAWDLIGRVAPTDAIVLLTGESGTGKELAAMTLHDMSSRRDRPFLAVNCGAVAGSVIESELFGHEKGSFTGAVQRHVGFFERASGGTLLLDEISEMSQELQVKLLRVLETGKILRIGGEAEVPVDVRVVAATNRVPEAAVAEGKLRQDLLYRLRVFEVHMPPLRERGSDVRLIAEHFLEELNRGAEMRKTMSEGALRRIEAHAWPGNVRELRNAVQAAFIVADSAIGPEHLALAPGSAVATPAPDFPAVRPVAGPAIGGEPATEVRVPVGETLDEAERRFILATWESCGRNKARAAKVLEVSPKTLYNRLKRYGLLSRSAGTSSPTR